MRCRAAELAILNAQNGVLQKLGLEIKLLHGAATNGVRRQLDRVEGGLETDINELPD